MTSARGAEIAAAVRVEGDGHVVARRAGRRMRWQPAVLPGCASVEREVGRDELGVRRGRGLAAGEELLRVPGIRCDRRLDMHAVTVVSDADVPDADIPTDSG